MKFYEHKYQFNVKELRPFAEHTQIKELNPLYNDKVYEHEMQKFLKQQNREKKANERKFFELSRNLE